MHRIGALRVATALAMTGAALAAGGTPAQAARPSRAAVFTPRMLAALAPRGGLLHRMAALLPGAAAPSLASLALFSDPTNVTVNGVTYRMVLSVQNLPAALDQPPELAVELDRTTSAGGRLTGEQAHVYGYAPIGGLDFHANAGLTRAQVTTGTSISPSAVDMRFHVSGTVEQAPCTLLGGGRGTFQAATGTLSAQTFRIATGTTPFFGTITTVPATATIVHDPGCSTFAAAARTARPTRRVFHFPCAGRETIQHASLTSVWSSERGFGGGRVTELGLVESNPFGPDGVGHLAVGIGRGADMPAASAHPRRRDQGDRQRGRRPLHGRTRHVRVDREGSRLSRPHMRLGAAHLPLHGDPVRRARDGGGIPAAGALRHGRRGGHAGARNAVSARVLTVGPRPDWSRIRTGARAAGDAG